MSIPRHHITFQFDFPPEVQAERGPILNALDRAMAERTWEAVHAAQTLASAWLAQHPEDYAVWDAGEPIAMLAGALAIVAREERERQEREKQEREGQRQDTTAVAA